MKEFRRGYVFILKPAQKVVDRDWCTEDRRIEQTGIGLIAKSTGLTRQTVYRIKTAPHEAEAALAAWKL